ncbi:MAG: hypothetical protein IT348_16690, partial [Candidatus Eisenbacteria bacterium]|nr:hypothetical protein [Candidatus Eisenbacteria bacterium]
DHMVRVRELLGETPGVSYQMARLDARIGDVASALRGLSLYARSGLSRDAFGDPDFASIANDSSFTAVATRIRANAQPVQKAQVRHTLSDAGLLAEDVAYDARGRRFFVTSIARGEVIQVSAAGRERRFAVSPHAARWGLFGAAVDARRALLWVSEVATPTCEGHAIADSGRSALLAYSLATAKLVRRVEVARDGRAHALGDLCVGPDGSVYASDVTGAVLRLKTGARVFDTVAPAGTFASPQQPALSADGALLYVADYSRGIGIVTLATGRLDWLAFEPGIALQGIDGLLSVPGALLAVQNGVRPVRVMRFELDATQRRAVRSLPIESGTERLGEPTHGVIAGGTYVFLANSGWDRVGKDQKLVTGADATRPVLLGIPLAGTTSPRPGENP